MDLGSDSNLQRETSLTVALNGNKGLFAVVKQWPPNIIQKKDAGMSFCMDEIFRWILKNCVTIGGDIHKG